MNALYAALAGTVGSAFGAGPWGVAAFLLLILAAVFGTCFVAGQLNKKTDDTDLNNAGADAGNSATDLNNQAHSTATDLNNLQNNNPPTRPN